MDNRDAYNRWAGSYDEMRNKTRDLEAEALHSLLEKKDFNSCLEIGCGTGKNTQWLAPRVSRLTAVDFSEEMIARARSKGLPNVEFVVADVTKKWEFTSSKFDLVSFSLVLEHIQDLEHIFQEASQVLEPNGLIYLGELHPFKQYLGSKARFDTAEGQVVLGCFTHHTSDYVSAAHKNGISVLELKEYFVPGEKAAAPQILSLLLKLD